MLKIMEPYPLVLNRKMGNKRVMPNKRYIKGRRFEYRVKEWLKKHIPDALILRCAGSKPFDLVVIRKGRDGHAKVLLVECKAHDYVNTKEVEEKRRIAEEHGATFMLATPKWLKIYEKMIRDARNASKRPSQR